MFINNKEPEYYIPLNNFRIFKNLIVHSDAKEGKRTDYFQTMMNIIGDVMISMSFEERLKFNRGIAHLTEALKDTIFEDREDVVSYFTEIAEDYLREDE